MIFHFFSGTVGANKSSVVLSINGSKFLPSGVAIGKNFHVFESGKDKLDLSAILSQIKQNGEQVMNLAVASGLSKSFVLAQTAKDLSVLNVADLSVS